MRITKAVVTAFFVLAAGGCVGGVDDLPPDQGGPDAGTGPGPGTAAKQLYVNTIHTAITMRCTTTACHGQANNTIYGFSVPDANEAYTRITSLPTLVGTYTPASAAFLIKPDTNPAGGHYNIIYSADDKMKITAWLAAEAAERNNGSQPPPIDPVAKLREWSGCMSIDNFNTAQMALRWGGLAAQNQQQCRNCHGGGAFAFMSGNGQAQAQIFFDTITTQKDLLLKYFTVDAMGQVIINNASFQNAGVVLESHPKFDPMTNLGMTALIEFYDLTKARQTAATCDPPRLPAM